MAQPSFILLFAIGLFAGVLSGMFGIGGGVVIVPALIYVAGFRQHVATGTSLAVLLPPIGIAAAFEYYRNGRVDVRAAMEAGSVPWWRTGWKGRSSGSHSASSSCLSACI